METLLFAIHHKDDNEMCSTNLTPFMVHYLFIDKKWSKENCIIYNQFKQQMSYATFCERHPLQKFKLN